LNKSDTQNSPQNLSRLDVAALNYKRLTASVLSNTLYFMVSDLVKKHFVWVLPVMLSKTTDPLWPDPGASIEKRIDTEIYGEKVRITTSMIVHKMVYCSLVHPRLFIVSPNVRIEKRERRATGWHCYEFTQLDFELKDGDFESVRSLVEDLLRNLVNYIKGNYKDTPEIIDSIKKTIIPETKFPVFDAQSLKESKGEDWEKELIRESKTPFWVRNIPREFYDYEDPETGVWDNYDLFLPRYGEVLSGAKREWEYDKIKKKMERDGVSADMYKELLQLAKSHRLSPSAGAGIGVERLVTWLCGAKSIEQVQPFPRIPGVVLDF